MTYPTKALAPLMLEDYRNEMVERRGEEGQFTSEHIAQCTKKVIAVDLKQTVQVDIDLQIRAYYAGHVHTCVAGGGKVLIPSFGLGRPQVGVDMGEPILKASGVPTRLPANKDQVVVKSGLNVDGVTWDITCVSMGSPHCVTLGTDKNQKPGNDASITSKISIRFTSIIGLYTFSAS